MQKVDYVMVMVTDMAKSVKFYKEVIGLELKMESPGWTEFKTGDTTLALHAGGKKAAGPMDGQMAGMCSIGFNSNNLEETHKQLLAKGAHVVMPPTERKDEGIKLMVIADPDGMGISYAEMLKTAHHH